MKRKKSPKSTNKPKSKIRLFKRSKSFDEKVSDAISVVPRITNDTLADHREVMLSSARKYIYPLQHSKHSVVRISVSLFILVVLIFVTICSLDLYKFQGTSGFIFDVTKIIPFPAAKVGGSWVSYESYLFELRRNMHYYITQQQADFSTKNGQAQLARLKEQAMDEAIQNALVKQLASQYHVGVSNQAVNNELNLVKSENRLGSSNQVFKEVISQYYGWSENDFKTELKQQLLQQAVVAKLDTQANNEANSVLHQLKSGANFATLASQVSEDSTTKSNGGEYQQPITINDNQVSPVITQALFQLKPGQISGVINTGYTLEIVKVLDRTGTTLHAAHIQINLNSINTYTQSLGNKEKTHKYISV